MAIPTCAVTGAIPGDGGACGDCDPCIDGERHVPEVVKRLIAEKNSLLQQVGELETAKDVLVEALKPFKQFHDGLSKAMIASGGRMPNPSDLIIQGPGEGSLGGRLEWQHFLAAEAATAA